MNNKYQNNIEILPIQDSWSNVILNFEHGSSNWGVTMAGYPLFIP